jgi:FMN-dependent oxidoreductase (nitrilotriacetate monooxygenase family)
MSGKPFHLAWFVSRGYGPKAWRETFAGSASTTARWMMPDLFVDLARAMERACFDYMIIEDSCNVPYTYQGSHDVYLRYAAATPKLDPAVLVPLIGQATKRLGIVPTLSTTEYPPFLLARLVNSLDHITEGRAGWNLVTGSNDGGAQNYGRERQYEHDERYDMADEFADLVGQLWDSWEPDAVVMDRERVIFADGKKVHPVHFAGKYFRSRGPLSAPRSPQGRPVICQAGGSPRGRRFAARWADTIIAATDTVAKMKAYREDIRATARECGRDPDSIKVLFQAYPIVDETNAGAEARRTAEIAEGARHIDMHLALMSRTSGIDFSKFDLDEPLGALSTNGHQSQVSRYSGRTPREIATHFSNRAGGDFTGSVDRVASIMQETMAEVGGDGFLISNTYFSRRYVSEITDGLVPELQRRGLTRTAYEHALFRDNLLAF